MTVQSAQVRTVLRSVNYVHKHGTRHQYFNPFTRIWHYSGNNKYNA